MKKILRPGKNCMGIFGVNESGLIVDGQDYYRAFFEAARKARRYILVAGWQFDSEVRLLRGKNASNAGEARLLPFLKLLCEKNRALHIYLLAWDFAEIYVLDREWFQEWVFNWTDNKRIHFLFDDRHAVGASHHEKFAVIDGLIAFAGGMDICAGRWDNRNHLVQNPDRRNPADKPYEPYHDTQSCHRGPAAKELAGLFSKRWEYAGGEKLHLPPVENDGSLGIGPVHAILTDKVAISRTRGRTMVPPLEPIQEIRNLYIDALEAAEELIYIENQYFTSQAVHRALTKRMKAKKRSKLQIILLLPRKLHAFTENVALGTAQIKTIKSLRDTAVAGGHSMGIYYSLAEPAGKNVAVYIHSKLMIVDDRFMTLGSANTSNRSMGLDTELNVSWETNSKKGAKLIRSIKTARADLLREHAGLKDNEDFDMSTAKGLVERLDELAGSGKYRLKCHTIETLIKESGLPEVFRSEDLAFDPEKPVLEENVFETISNDKTGIFAEGITALSNFLVRSETGIVRRTLQIIWRRRWFVFWALLFAAPVFWLLLR